MAEDKADSRPLPSLDLEPGESRIGSWAGREGSSAVVLILTDRRLVILAVKGLWSRRYEPRASFRLEGMPSPRAHDAYGGRRLEIAGSDYSFSRASEDEVREEIVRARDRRAARLSGGSR